MEKFSGTQGGEREIIHKQYGYLLKWLPKRPLDILNLGSGTALAFERFLNQKRGGIDRILCVDLADRGRIRLPVNVTYQEGCNLEKPIELGRRFDLVCCFECMEHVDKTDVLLDNGIRHMKEKGLLAMSVPNLASLYGRMLLLAGFQPYILEISNRKSFYGQGKIGKVNNPSGEPIHHIRGITYRAMREMLEDNGLLLFKVYGSLRLTGGLFKHMPSLAGDVMYLCKKAGHL